MTGPQHYETAENLLQDAANLYQTDASKARFMQAAAHTHAILAQTGALMADARVTLPGYEDWAAVLT